MTVENSDNSRDDPFPVGSGYAGFELARALVARVENPDAGARDRAKQRIADWKKVVLGILSGVITVGSRKPVDVPEWATLKVLTGGFATGEILAGGAILDYEKALADELSIKTEEGDIRRLLNSYYVSENGLSRLRQMIASGGFEIQCPEEGALLVVAWLAENDQSERARQLLETLAPWFAKLRFYPRASDSVRKAGTGVFLQTVGQVKASLEGIKPNENVLAQREAVCTWTPFYDNMVRMWLETVDGPPPVAARDFEGRWSREENRFVLSGGWPCQRYREGWASRAHDLLSEFRILREAHQRCGAVDRTGSDFETLLKSMRKAASDSTTLTGREVGRIRLILARYIAKRGLPDSDRCAETRRSQERHAKAPTLFDVSKVVVERLGAYWQDGPLDEPESVLQPMDHRDSERFRLPVGTAVPTSVTRKVERCRRGEVDDLIESGIITSSETLARLLPQITASINATGIADPDLRRVWSSIYEGFRRRRSLLLLNLEKQVQFEELPWIQVLEHTRKDSLSARRAAEQALHDLALCAITRFPQAIVPNKLLQELSFLVKRAGLELPLVEEVAADIFMGEFTAKFLLAARRSAALLDGTLYATYYRIDCRRIQEMTDSPSPPRPFSGSGGRRGCSAFVLLCAERAGVDLGGWNPATNGMIIEQQQILTTHNLAILFEGLGLSATLQPNLGDLAKNNFKWICRTLQTKAPHRHARLVAIKNAAYAWRQLVFFLAMTPKSEQAAWLGWADESLASHPERFRTRFSPILDGLLVASQRSEGSEECAKADWQCFVGWSQGDHWLL